MSFGVAGKIIERLQARQHRGQNAYQPQFNFAGMVEL
jgi:hypothetical protein